MLLHHARLQNFASRLESFLKRESGSLSAQVTARSSSHYLKPGPKHNLHVLSDDDPIPASASAQKYSRATESLHVAKRLLVGPVISWLVRRHQRASIPASQDSLIRRDVYIDNLEIHGREENS